jgi:hypothetical protein
VQSPNYPSRYSNNQKCTIAIDAANAAPIVVERFNTEFYFDYILIDGWKSFSGRRRRPHGFIPYETIEWSSDSSVTRRGWRMCEPDRRLLEEATRPDEPAMALTATHITPGTSVQQGEPAPPPEPTEAEVEADIEAGRAVIGILVMAAGLPLWALLVRCALQKRTSAPRRSDLADSDAKGRRNSGVYIDVHGDTEKRERSSVYVPL